MILKGRKILTPGLQLNVLKCVLSIRRSKTEKINVFFYEILSPAGLFASRMAYSPEEDGESKKITVDLEAESFLNFTEELFKRQTSLGKILSSSVVSSIESILGEILTPEAVRESMDSLRGSMKTLEERIREELSSRLGYRATTYLKGERADENRLAPFIRSGNASEPSSEKEILPPGSASYVVPCSPFIDPIKGIPVGSLQNGVWVLLRITEDENSSFLGKMRQAVPGFDGTVKASVISVHKDRKGNYTLLVRLSDEFNGVVSLEGNSRIRTTTPDLPEPLPVGEPEDANQDAVKITPESSSDAGLYFLAFGAMAVLLVLLIFLRFFR